MSAKKATKQMALDDIEALLTQIEAAELDVQKAAIELDARKEAAKTAKGVWLTRIETLQTLIGTRRRWNEERKRQPLLAAAEAAAQTVMAAVEAHLPDPNPAGWRDVRLDTFGLGTRTMKALDAAGLTTLGLLTDFQMANGEWWVRNVKGLGEMGSDKIAEKVAEFWKEHPEYCRS
jgi:hypothetical protein